jgi:hypothetical protein
MITVFKDIPSYFIERYDVQIQEWGANFAKIGRVKSIVLREGQFADVSPDPEVGAVLIAVKLIASYEAIKKRMTVEPFTERDKELIWKHCDKMRRLKVHPRMILPEPARPGLPFMPAKLWNPPKPTEH